MSKIIRIKKRSSGGGVTPSGIAYNRIIDTGQLVSVRVGDDVWVRDNIPDNPAPTNPLYKQELVDFYNLLHPNFAGNYKRFTDELGVPNVNEDPTVAPDLSFRYILDNYTGRGILWAATYLSNTQSFNSAIDNSLAINTLGFNDFYLPNVNELQSIQNYRGNLYNVNVPWAGGGRILWSSTTRHATPLDAYTVSTQAIQSISTKATSNRAYVAFRKHF